MEIIGREQARQQSLKFYFSGKLCRHGHISNRYVSNNICVECQSNSNKKHWTSNQDVLLEKSRYRRETNREKYNNNRREKYKNDAEFKNRIKSYSKYWATKNKHIVHSEKYRELRNQYQHKHKQKCSTINKKWRVNNREWVNNQSGIYQNTHRAYYTARQALYRANKRNATPQWCEYQEIGLLYLESKRISKLTGITHQVDHIIPITHPLVCGLHCLANLRIITETENKIKHNKFIMFDY